MLQYHSSSWGRCLETGLHEPALSLKNLCLPFCSPTLGGRIHRRIFPIRPNDRETDYLRLCFPDCWSWEQWGNTIKATASKHGLSRTMMNGLGEACAYSHSIIKCWRTDSRQEGRRPPCWKQASFFSFWQRSELLTLSFNLGISFQETVKGSSGNQQRPGRWLWVRGQDGSEHRAVCLSLNSWCECGAGLIVTIEAVCRGVIRSPTTFLGVFALLLLSCETINFLISERLNFLLCMMEIFRNMVP